MLPFVVNKDVKIRAYRSVDCAVLLLLLLLMMIGPTVIIF